MGDITFDSPAAGDRTASVTVTLNTNNFVFEDGSKTRTFQLRNSSYVWIDKATVAAPAAAELTVYNGLAKTYEIALPALPELESPKAYGETTYTVKNVDLGSYYTDGARVEKGKLILPILKNDVTSTGKIGTVTVTVTTTNYTDITLTVNVTAANKIVPTVDKVSASAITYGDALSKSEISGKMKDPATGEEVAGTFAWENGDRTLTAGTHTVSWIFTPTAPEYATATGTVTVTVDPKSITGATVTLAQSSFVYSGSEQTAAVSAVALEGWSLAPITYTIKSGSAATNAGNYTLTIEGKGNYIGTATASWSITAKPVTANVTVNDGPFTYDNGNEIRPAVTVKDGTTPIPADEYTVEYSSNTNAGTATVTVKDNEGGNYTVSGSTNFEIAKAASSCTAPTAKTLTYNGTDQALVTAGSTQDGTTVYSLTENGEYSAAIPTGKNAGSYTVYYKVAGDANHNDTDPASVSVTVGRAAVTVTAENKSSRVGQALQPLTYTYRPELFTGDSFTGTLATTADKDTVKDYPITQGTLSLGENYQITFNEGIYSVLAKLPQTAFKFAESAVERTYGDGDFTLAATGAAANSTVTYSSSDPAIATVDAATGTVHILKADAVTITAAASETADHLEGRASYTLTVKRQPVAIPLADPTAFIYNGTEQTYFIAENPLYTVSGHVQKNAGSHTVTVALQDAENYVWSDNTSDAKEYSFVIAQKTVTVTVLDKRAYTGSAAPDLSAPVQGTDYTVEGLLGGDTLLSGPTLTYDPAVPDMRKAGAAAKIVATNADAGGNYRFVYIPGTLTLVDLPNPVGPSAPAVDLGEPKNGSVAVSPKHPSKGDTVLITVEPDEGYALDEITVTDKDGDALQLTDKGDGKYSFTMPSGKADINATFKKQAETSPFADVSTDAYYYEAVKWAAENSITGGVGSGLFGPDDPCTRAQIVTFLWRAAGSPVVNYAMNMTDVAEDVYYAEAVRWALSEGITTGTGENRFSPDAPCTRGQAVTFLARALNAKAAGAASFSDVPADAYFAQAVAWAAENGITTGVGENRFAPEDPCTRAQIVTLLWRAYRQN